MSEAQEHPSIEDLRSIPVFADLAEEQLQWLQSHFSNEVFPDGDVIVTAGTVATSMVAIF